MGNKSMVGKNRVGRIEGLCGIVTGGSRGIGSVEFGVKSLRAVAQKPDSKSSENLSFNER